MGFMGFCQPPSPDHGSPVQAESIISVFPTEIWRMILRYATLNPLFLDTSPLPPLSDDFRITAVGFRDAGHFNFLAKRSLVLVCRLWQSLAIEFLYEWIEIDVSKPTSVDSLPRSLETNVESPGRYVQRLHLKFNRWSTGPSGADRLNSVLQHCHGLQALEILGTQWHPPDLSVILDRVASLRYFRIVWTSDDQSPTNFIPLFSNMSRLRSLEYLDFSWWDDWDDFPTEHVTFPQLHTMDLITENNNPKNVLDKIATSWELPALRSLFISPARNSEPLTPRTLTPILKTHGSHLTTLRLHAGYGWPHHAVLLDLVSAFCPLVEDLSVHVVLWPGENGETNNDDFVEMALPFVLPHVRLLRIENTILPDYSLCLDNFLRFIFNMTTTSLLSIQLKEFPDPYADERPSPRWLPKI
jgi:hypothetical protein